MLLAKIRDQLHNVTTRLLLSKKRNVPYPKSNDVDVIVFSHNLKPQGAPLSLLELASGISKAADMRFGLMHSGGGLLEKKFMDFCYFSRRLQLENLQELVQPKDLDKELERIKSSLAEVRFKIVHANTLKSLTLAIACVEAGEKILWNIREGADPKAWFEGLSSPLQSKTLESIAKIDAIVFNSEKVKKMWEQYFQLENTRSINTVLDPHSPLFARSTFSRETARAMLGLGDEKVIIIVGTLSQRKNQMAIFEALEEIGTLNYKLSFIFIGSGGSLYPDYLKKQAASIFKETGIEFLFTDEISRDSETMRHYFLAADFLVHPSKEEGLTRVLLEAKEFGLPFLAFDVGGNSEIAHSHEQAIIARTGKDFSKILRDLLENKLVSSKRTNHSSATTHLERFQEFLAEYEEVYFNIA